MTLPTLKANSNLMAYYDFKSSPITNDFVFFLAAATAYAELSGYNMFDLTLVADGWRKLSPREKSYGIDERKWRLWNLIMPVITVNPSIGNTIVTKSPLNETCSNSFPPDYHPRLKYYSPYTVPIIKRLHEKGAKLVCYHSSAHASKYVKNKINKLGDLVTLTPRVASFDGRRNSALEEWFEVYKELVSLGFYVLVIPDQDDFLSNKLVMSFNWNVAVEACFNLDIKLAFYEAAVQNVISAGGNAAVLHFSSAPCLILNLLHEGHYVADNNYWRKVGIPEGTKPSWFRSNQNYVWEGDTKNNILNALKLHGTL
jgi:hypothetical protein